MNFDFEIAKKGIPTVSVTSYGFAFNETCIEALGYPKYIKIGIDGLERKLGIQPVTKEGESCVYHFVTNEKRKKHILVSATKAKNLVFQMIEKFPRRNGFTYSAKFDKDLNILIVDLTEEQPLSRQ